jgi:glycosyltransferase involved in cell wall biosynthesis
VILIKRLDCPMGLILRKARMHVGFDISQVGQNKAGCGYFAHAMIQALVEGSQQDCYSLFPSFGDFYFDARMPFRNPYSSQNVRYGPRHWSRERASSFWNSDELEASLGRPDIIHANNFWCPVQLRSSRLVYTFYDLSFAIEPSWTTEANRIGCFEGVFRSSLVADWIVAISEASAAQYSFAFPHFPKERIRVLYPCSRFVDAKREGTRPDRLAAISADGFWLSVGTIEPRKNQRRLAQAYARFRALGGAPMPLVLAGGSGWLMDDFAQQLKEMGVAKDVVMTGYVTDDELIWLYRNCYANLYPSLFEGFGLPVLEGMQFGAATLSSDATSLPEVAGDAAILLDPTDTDGWARAMFDLSRDPSKRSNLRSRCSEQAFRFSWQKSATDLRQLYGDALAIPKRCILDRNSGAHS